MTRLFLFLGILLMAFPASGMHPFCIGLTHEGDGLEGPRGIQELLVAHQRKIREGRKVPPREENLNFIGGPEGRDLYNSPGEFSALYEGRESRIFIGREESPQSELDMRVAFYKKHPSGNYLYLNGKPGVPNLSLQDPFVSHIDTWEGRELILGGVKVWEVEENGKKRILYKTVFYRDHGKGIEHLTPFLEGPNGMKDIRLAQSPNKQIITVFTRPQHAELEKGGPGRVGMFHVRSLEEITAEKISAAPIFHHQFEPKEWGGVNAAQYIDEHRIGVIGHYARFQGKNRQYVAVSWVVDTRTFAQSKAQVILRRSDLPGGLERGSKRDDLKDVLFPGGFEFNLDGTITIWGGEGDKRTFKAIVENPFAKK